MRKYRINYWAEISDECEDREIELEADSVMGALLKFSSEVKVYKRVFKIEEI